MTWSDLATHQRTMVGKVARKSFFFFFYFNQFFTNFVFLLTPFKFSPHPADEVSVPAVHDSPHGLFLCSLVNLTPKVYYCGLR